MTPPTIDDAVAAFVACEPGDADARRRLREILWSVVCDRSLASEARNALADAVALLDDPAAFAPAAEASSLVLLRLHLEVAVDRLEMASTGGATAHGSARTPTDGAPGGAAVATRFEIPGDADGALIGDFVGEAHEFLEVAEAALLRLEGAPDDAESVNDVFRAFHTIKGTSSFLGLGAIASFAHHAEDMLGRVRGGELAFTGTVPELSLRAVDQLKALIAAVPAARAGGVELSPEYAVLIAAMKDPLAVPASPATPSAEARAAAPAAAAPAPGLPEGTVKVRAEKLDRLVEMVGELVIAHGILKETPAVQDASQQELTQRVLQADKIVRELQELALGLRMVPLRGALTKLTRIVRDLAARSGKQVVFETAGEDTELDRTLVDLVADPLMHMVRNAVDHGIETPSERLAAGKPAMGTIRVEARQAGDRVLVRLRDDGRGLQRSKIIAKAIERGLITSGEGMPDAAVFELIFAPGFSTADAITDVSGRGVGMDVVRRNLLAIRGRTLIESEPGKGSVFTIELPLTLAITDGMVVRVQGERFIIPTARIRRCVRPAPEMLRTALGRGELLQQGGEVLPLLRLQRELRIPGPSADLLAGILIVAGDGHNRVALHVDELLGQQQVVAKPLGESIGRVRGLTGGAILGDGRVGLILDVDELVQASRSAAPAPPHAAPHAA
ncbi:MAG: chemotaxis protein CheA [Gemmatimonadetes bacterium]|nr:chemotaxis protein CheA [Gemmatimonadota bacterium]